MKNYRLLNDGEIILATDEFWFDLANAFSNDWDSTDIGKSASDFPAPIRREVPPPQWQTGEIPEPTELCIVVIESPDDYPIILQSINIGCWRWSAYGPLDYEANQILTKRFATGRWYIQPITLPTT